ncbi:MAG TPA: deoxyribodipyrimidine photolyase [Rhizobiales bacterium]|nr:deoxyribodipyrimidine photolyase [Hyphomicrobiales bacterium]
MTNIAIHWFRQDLRLSDNPSLRHACESGAVVPVYILEDEEAAAYQMGGASRWWLHQSLRSLNQSLDGNLRLFRGRAADILLALQELYGADVITWTRCYEPWRMTRDEGLKEQLRASKATVISQNGSLLWEPWQVKKADGTPYKVFTPFFRKGCLQSAPPPALPLGAPEQISYAVGRNDGSLDLADLKLEPQRPEPNWHLQLAPHWKIGEKVAQQKALSFFQSGLQGYKQGRDFPAKAKISLLSPHLHFGEISPNQVWYGALDYLKSHSATEEQAAKDLDHFLSELTWREFSYSLLFYNRDLPEEPINPIFGDFSWREDDRMLRAWQKGQTGIPIVDAGMRQLWQTGFMHNRLRMIVASFLIKNLRIDWRVGQAWFWDCLVDADLASNSASWQWVAGCGADAAPYFRIFNPVLQGEKFDKNGAYTRQYVPELSALPDKYLFKPWQAPKALLEECGITLGVTYPHPIVDLKQSRNEALEAYQNCRV